LQAYREEGKEKRRKGGREGGELPERFIGQGGIDSRPGG